MCHPQVSMDHSKEKWFYKLWSYDSNACSEPDGKQMQHVYVSARIINGTQFVHLDVLGLVEEPGVLFHLS